MIKGRDVIAQAQSGTGKTATFSISVLQTIDVGSVKGGTPAEVRTDAVLTGTVTQDAKGNLLSRQIIQIAFDSQDTGVGGLWSFRRQGTFVEKVRRRTFGS